MALVTQNLFHVGLSTLFDTIREEIPHYAYDYKKHQVVLSNEHHDAIGQVRLPLHVIVEEDLVALEEEWPRVLYLTITAGNAAVCVMEGEELGYHTTLGAYMSRKKQGFSQIKYLNKKGKSRAGSRVRLAATYTFFENINTLLEELFDEGDFDRIAIDCPTTLIPYLFQSKVDCPFEKKDPRIYKIPLHLPQSNFTTLEAAIKKLKAPILSYEEKDAGELSCLLELAEHGQ